MSVQLSDANLLGNMAINLPDISDKIIKELQMNSIFNNNTETNGADIFNNIGKNIFDNVNSNIVENIKNDTINKKFDINSISTILCYNDIIRDIKNTLDKKFIVFLLFVVAVIMLFVFGSKITTFVCNMNTFKKSKTTNDKNNKKRKN